MISVKKFFKNFHLPTLSSLSLQNETRIFQISSTNYTLCSRFEVEKAEGSYIYGKDGRAYLDFVAGVSANTLGHSHPKVVNAIKEQADKYLHVMVYGEYAQEKPVELCRLFSRSDSRTFGSYLFGKFWCRSH